MNSCYSGEELTGFFALEQQNPMRSYFVSIQTVPVPCRIHFPVMFYGGTIILFHAFTRTGAVVSLSGRRPWPPKKKTQEARSLIGTNKQAPFKCLPLLIMLALGETIDHSPVPVWISSGESLLDYSQDIPNEMQGASNQHLVQSHRQIQTCVSIKCEDRQVR
jgi:hypothetical protein